MRKPTRAREGRGRLFPLAPLALLLAVAALASALALASQRDESTGSLNFVPPSGLYSSLDPRAEGWVEPTPEEAQQLRAAMQAQYGRTAPVTITRSPDGTLKAELPDDYMEVMVLQLNADGTHSVQCVPAPTAAARMAADATRSAAAPVTASSTLDPTALERK